MDGWIDRQTGRQTKEIEGKFPVSKALRRIT